MRICHLNVSGSHGSFLSGSNRGMLRLLLVYVYNIMSVCGDVFPRNLLNGFS